MDSLAATMAAICSFRDRRDWAQFHRVDNLAAALVIEAGELLENFLWVRNENEARERLDQHGSRIREEVADVLIYALGFCAVAEIDPLEAIRDKLRINEERYPVDLSRGKATKHSDLPTEDD